MPKVKLLWHGGPESPPHWGVSEAILGVITSIYTR